MKSLREQFEDDYMAVSVPANNKDGFQIKYVYYGPWYIWELPEKELKRKKGLFAGVSLGSLLLYVLAGVQYCLANSQDIVTAAGILALCAHVFEIFHAFEFLFAKYRTSRLTYRNVNRSLRTAPAIRGACLLTASVFSGLSMVWNGWEIRSFFAAADYLICAAAAFWIFAEYRMIPFTTEKNENPVLEGANWTGEKE